jgi:hypothetical protein
MHPNATHTIKGALQRAASVGTRNSCGDYYDGCGRCFGDGKMFVMCKIFLSKMFLGYLPDWCHVWGLRINSDRKRR